LYLLGTLLHLDGDPDRARILIDTAMALVGQQRHLTAFRADPGLVDPAAAERPPAAPMPRQQQTPGLTAPQHPALPTQPCAPHAEDVPAVPQESDAGGSDADSSDAPQLPPQGNSNLPSIDTPGGPVFPTSLK